MSASQEAVFRGVFCIPPTPFTDEDQVDETSLRRCVDFCIDSGAHGLVGPVNASEAIALTDDERVRVAEVIIQQAAGRIPVVVGVSSHSSEASIDLARHAREHDASAIMAMPPYVQRLERDEIVTFYRRLAAACQPLPIWIQNYVAPVGTPMDVELLTRIVRSIDGPAYVKEETSLAPQAMTRLRNRLGPAISGIMGGMAGRFMIEEYRRGSDGTMPACEVVEVHLQIWEALEAGDEATARKIHAALMPLLNYEAMYSYTVYKEVLRRRGIIATARTRVPGAAGLDEENHRELDRILEDLAPLMTPTPPATDQQATTVSAG